MVFKSPGNSLARQPQIGPKPILGPDRRALVEQIAARVRAHYEDQLLASGLYGSVARDLDGPYSDIEMHCVLRGKGVEIWHEWVEGPWKAEVDAFSRDVVLQYASELEGDWAMTHGSYVYVRPLYDPEGFFPKLSEAARTHPEAEFEKAMGRLIVDAIYEMVGKLRNAHHKGNTSALSLFTVHLTMYGAWLLGLAHRHLFTSASTMFTEALALPARPAGFDPLCQIVMTGALSDADQVFAAVDTFWQGIVQWATARELQIVDRLEAIFPLRR